MKRLISRRSWILGAVCTGTLLQSSGCALNAEAFAYTFLTTLLQTLLTTLASSAAV